MEALKLIDGYARQAGEMIAAHQSQVAGLIAQRLASNDPLQRVERLQMLNGVAAVPQQLMQQFMSSLNLIEQIELMAYADLQRDLESTATRIGTWENLKALREARLEQAKHRVAEAGRSFTHLAAKADHKLLSRVAILSGSNPRETAVHQAKVELMLKPLPFDVNDASGARWTVASYFETAMRAFAMNTYVETYLVAAANYGETDFVVYHENPEHPSSDLPINTRVDDALSIFHPNFRGLPLARPTSVHS